MSAPRHIYAVRHAERIDDVEGKKRCWYLNSHFSKDNPPLSLRGIQQAQELFMEFLNIPIDYCFSSPYERCVQTAAAILEGRPNVKINIEPGLLESAHVIYERSEVKQLDFQTNKELIHRFPNINQSYQPVYLAPPPEERKFGVQGCFGRVEQTCQMIIDKCRGDILIVSHMHPLAALQRMLTGDIDYGGCATVSKYVEVPGLDGRFTAEYIYDSSHLSDPTKLSGSSCNRKTGSSSKPQKSKVQEIHKANSNCLIDRPRGWDMEQLKQLQQKQQQQHRYEQQQKRQIIIHVNNRACPLNDLQNQILSEINQSNNNLPPKIIINQQNPQKKSRKDVRKEKKKEIRKERKREAKARRKMLMANKN